jgi:hypothetical protein
VDDLPGQQTDEVDSLLAVGQAVVFPCDDRAVEDAVAARKVEPVLLDVAFALRLIPSQLELSVPTKSKVVFSLRFNKLLSGTTCCSTHNR